MRQIYALPAQPQRIMVMGVRSAEAHQVRRQRHARHAHLVHEQAANLAEALGADIEELRRGIGPIRIGYQFLYPAPASAAVLPKAVGRCSGPPPRGAGRCA
jgi:UDPglucose 6-dehydrogenase